MRHSAEDGIKLPVIYPVAASAFADCPLPPQRPFGRPSVGISLRSICAPANGVATLDTPLADPDSEAIRQKMNELILAQQR